MVDIKSPERNNARQQYLPGSLAELPALCHGYAERVENKQQEQRAMYRAKGFYQLGVVADVFERDGDKYQYQQRNAFKEADDPEPANVCFE